MLAADAANSWVAPVERLAFGVLSSSLYAPAVGTLAAHCAFFKGAGRVVLIDNQADRLQFAKDRMPKLETINFSSQKVAAMYPMTAISAPCTALWNPAPKRREMYSQEGAQLSAPSM